MSAQLNHLLRNILWIADTSQYYHENIKVYELGMNLDQNYWTWPVLAMDQNQCWLFGPGQTWAHLN